MASFRAAYLIHGDDHGRIAERRGRLRAMAEADGGSAAVETFEGETCTPEAVAGALSAMTFAMGRRFVIADGVERWKEADVTPVAEALSAMDPATTTAAFFGREEGRWKVPAALVKAVEGVGGAVAAEMTLKAKDLPRWVVQRAAELELELDIPAARALIAQVGDRQQRLLREVEKLALEHGPGAHLGAAEVAESGATSSERKVWTLADAIVAGDARTATRALLELRSQGERLPGLIYGIVRRLRDATAVAEALAAGQPAAQVKRTLRMPPFAADRLISDVSKRDVEAFRRALERMADLELESRGGADAALSDETAALRAVVAASR